jgi:hypothetical protein
MRVLVIGGTQFLGRERIARRAFEALGVLLSVHFALAVAWWMLS